MTATIAQQFWRKLYALALLIAICAPSSQSLRANYTFTTIIDNAGSQDPVFGALGQRKINDSGEVAFLTSPTFFNYEIYRGNGASATQVADNSFWGLDYGGNGAIANSGDVVFRGGTTGITVGIYRGSGGAPTPLLIGNQSDNAADGPKLYFDEITVSSSGLIAYKATSYSCLNSVCTNSVSGYYTLINGSVAPLAQEGATWSTVGAFGPVINDSAHAAFTMTSAQDSTIHLLMHNGSSTTTVKAGFIGGKGYSLNNAGQLAYAEIPAVKVVTNGVTTTVASTADGFDVLMKVGTGEVFINDSGNVAFWGSVTQFQGNPVVWDGIYTGPNILSDRVLVWGDSLLGHTVGTIELLGMNNSGQILMNVEAQGPDPWKGLVVASPPSADYNHNGVIDTGDYVVWRKTGTGGQQGYDLWRANYGNAAASGSNISVANIPEPAALSLALIAIALGGCRRSKTYQNTCSAHLIWAS